MKKVAKIWTIQHRPLIMGGDVNRPISTTTPIIETRKIRGLNFFAFKTPKGTIRVCDNQTGGIIANSFEELIENIKGVPKKTLQQQINEQKSNAQKAFEMTQEEFFKIYNY